MNDIKDEIFNKIINTKLFSTANRDELRRILSKSSCFEISRSGGESLERNGEKRLGIILSGSVKVMSSDRDKGVLLRTMKTGDIYGVATLFENDKESVTNMIAGRSGCSVFTVDADSVSELMMNDKAFLHAYIGFLSDRICFLNRKIVYYTAGTAERRLAVYLTSFGKEKRVTPDLPMNALAELLDVGRASLYRAVEALKNDGVLRDGNDFIIEDLDALKKKYKI